MSSMWIFCHPLLSGFSSLIIPPFRELSFSFECFVLNGLGLGLNLKGSGVAVSLCGFSSFNSFGLGCKSFGLGFTLIRPDFISLGLGLIP